jgi:peptide methionine sulfoxide reductase msrA/msrB
MLKKMQILKFILILTISFGICYTIAKGPKMKPDPDNKNFNKLTPQEEAIIVHKGTERPFSGKYYKHSEKGTYTCKRCDAKLFTSEDKFASDCGWPSFDDAIPGAITFVPDKDGTRTEIICNNCNAHLGHIFTGEKLTEKNTRYCVNSLSLNFIPPADPEQLKTAYFAGGCFWGVEYFFQNAKGVNSTKVGYMGGHTPNPTYQQVCTGTTGHAEAIKVVYDPNVTTFEDLAKLFFEIHDPTQLNRQGPDVGQQYRSAIFYTDDQQKQTAQKLIDILKNKGKNITTTLVKADKFWPAEDYHQRYYEKNNKKPYCHFYKKSF